MNTRLHTHIKPEKYILALRPDLEKFTFYGEEKIIFRIEEPKTSLTFHALDLEILAASLIGEKGQALEKADFANDNEAHTVTFTFPKELPAGEHILQITFNGILSERMKGFYRSTYSVNGEEKVMATTQFEEIGARQAFVSIDEPSAKAVFDITLSVPKHLEAVSNTISEQIEEYDDGYKSIHFAPTPKMSTYLVAFIVGELEYIEKKTKEGVLVRAFATPGKKDQLAFALDVAVKALSFYQNYFDVPYPLPVLDMIAIPDFDAGAMENWGAVTFREAALLIDEKKSSLVNKQWVALVVAHEFAHMWFGNLVTMEWWTHLWLNEGFACYIEYLAVNTLFPEWELWKQFAVMEHNDALGLDSLNSTHPIEMPIESDKNVKEIFDEISYAKGASIIQMLATYLGPEVFRDGLRHYLKKHAYTNTVTEDLWAAFEEVSGQEVRKVMQNWTQKPGYPLLKLDDQMKLTQSRFFSNISMKEKAKDTTVWQVPLNMLLTDNTTVPYLLQNIDDLLPYENLTKINAQETSFVRVLYNNTMYESLSREILDKKLSTVDRMGILRDLFDASQAGYISSDVVLTMLSSYKKEDEYIVWSTIVSGLNALYNILYNTEAFDNFERFARNLLGEIVKKVGWEKKEEESFSDVLLRSVVLYAAGKFGDTEVINKAKEMFEKYYVGEVSIDSDIRGVVYMLVAKNGTQKEWDKLVELYTKESLHQEKNRIMLALCGFSNLDLLQQTLDWSFLGKVEFQAEAVRMQDKSRILLAMFGNSTAQKITWEFLKKHWDAFENMYKGLHGFTRLIEGAGDMVGGEMLSDVRNFFETHKVEAVEMSMRQVLERIEANTNWQQRDLEKISAFLKNS